MAFPNVPRLPGVPPLPRAPGATAITGLVLLAADNLIGALFGSAEPLWGIFLDGQPVVDTDCVVSVDFRQDWSLADYPIQDGGFETYDKVNNPFDVRVRYACGGSEARRQAFLTSIETIGDTLELYDVVSPEKVLPFCNVEHYDYRRTAQNGVGMITVDVWLKEVRVGTSAGLFQNTISPTNTGNVGRGAVQTSSFERTGFTFTPDLVL